MALYTTQFNNLIISSTIPISPIKNQYWDEIDSSGLLVDSWFWNGTYWLSRVLHFFRYQGSNNGGGVINNYLSLSSDYNLYLVDHSVQFRYTGGQTSSSYFGYLSFRKNPTNNNNSSSVLNSFTFNNNTYLPDTDYAFKYTFTSNPFLSIAGLTQLMYTQNAQGGFAFLTSSQVARYRLARI